MNYKKGKKNNLFHYTKWIPDKESSDIILAIHGYNDYSNSFDTAGKYLSHHNIETIAFDLRGFGENNNRGNWYKLQDHLDDIILNIQKIKNENPQKKIYLLGESMGGAIILSLANNYVDLPLDGLILVAPAIWNFSESNFWKGLVLKLFSSIFPKLKVSGKGIIKVRASDNIEMLKKLSKDKLFIHEPNLQSLQGITNLMDKSYQDTKSYLKMPNYRTLILIPIIDEIIPRKPLINLLKLDEIRNNLYDTVDIGVYKNSFHMILRDLKSEEIIDHIRIWINDKNKLRNYHQYKDSVEKLINNSFYHRLEK